MIFSNSNQFTFIHAYHCLVFHYLGDFIWQLEQQCRWIRTYFYITNILLSESCGWLSILKFLSANPFTIEDDDIFEKAPDKMALKIVAIAFMIVWLFIVIVHMLMNTAIQLIMVYHIFRKVSEVSFK